MSIADAASRYPSLFSPISLGPLALPHRVIMSGHGLLLSDQVVSDAYVGYIAARARGGAAMVGLQSEPVHSSGHHYGERHIALYRDDVTPGLARLAEAVHDAGSLVFQILWHAGHNVPFRAGTAAWAPSGVPSPVLGEVPKAMTRAEIRELVDAYGEAARRCREAGIDGVEVQTASDYLLGSFLSPATNRRSDEYGGSANNRVRIVAEILERVREAADGTAVALRTSAGWRVPADPDAYRVDHAIEVMGLLVERRLVDWISVTVGSHYSFDAIVPPMHEPRGNAVALAAAMKAALEVPIVVAGRIRTPQEAEAVVSSGQADVVAMARSWIADPDWVAKVVRGDEQRIRPCISCNQGCIGNAFRGAPGTCILNPVAGREAELGPPRRASKSVRVAVVGGGPAGLELARAAAERGHAVTLYEAQPALGGELRLAGRAPHREEMLLALEWWEHELAELGVRVLLNHHVAEDAALDAEIVVYATGAQPGPTAVWRLRPSLFDGIPGTHGLPHGRELLRGVRDVSGRVLIIDEEGGWPTVSVIETLAAQASVAALTVVTSLAAVGAPELTYSLELGVVTRRLHDLGIEIRTETLVERVADGSIRTVDGTRLGPFDDIVLCTGTVSPTLPAYAIAIGDAVAPRGLWAAANDALRLARSL
jgi:2,4-dienoyl-CoA reductase-like NADH-dependent reductase (Old Yellow Enzyme family)